MSLILDALNRADNERKNQDAVPGLNTVHVAPTIAAADKPASKVPLYSAIALAVCALVGSIAWFSAKPEPVSSGTTTSIKNTHQSSHQASSIAPQADEQEAMLPNVATGSASGEEPSEPASLAKQKSVESIITPRPAAVVEQLYIEPTSQSAPADAKVNELYAAGEAGESESISEPFSSEPVPSEPFPVEPAYASQPDRITRPLNSRVTEPGPARTFASITAIQDFNELPWNTKQQIPTISYQRHNFLAGGVSSVVINGQTLGEGNIAASSQLIVQEIFEDGVVLKKGNVVFKLRALNGWINM